MRTLEIRCNIDMTAANRHVFGRATGRKLRFLALPKTPLFNHLWVKTLFFQEKTRFSGMGVPPRRAAACTSGERSSDGACARSRENGAPNRPIWLQLLLLRAYGTTRPAILARFVAAAAAFAPPIPENLTQQVTFWWFLGGGGAFPQFWPLLGHNRWHRASCLHTVHFWKKNIS